MAVPRRAGGFILGMNSKQHSSLDRCFQLLKKHAVTLLILPRKFAKIRSLSITWATAQTMESMKLGRATTDTCCPVDHGARTKFLYPRNFFRGKRVTSPASGTGPTTLILYPYRSLSNLLLTNNLLQPAKSGLTNSQKNLQAAGNRRQATGGRQQAASSHGSLTRRQQAGGWARRPQAPGPRNLDKVLWTLDRGSWL